MPWVWRWEIVAVVVYRHCRDAAANDDEKGSMGLQYVTGRMKGEARLIIIRDFDRYYNTYPKFQHHHMTKV